MAGLDRLDPAIHALETGNGETTNRVNARVNSAHDDFWWVPIRQVEDLSVPRRS
jgi:hypothetical protein